MHALLKFSICLVLACLLNTSFLFGQSYNEVIKDQAIHSVVFHKKGNPKALPVIQLNSNERLKLRFDVLDDNYHSYQYRIVHCDFDWTESNLHRTDYQEGRRNAYIDDKQGSFSTYVNYTHLYLEFPNRDIRPTRSGNYALIVYKNNDPDDIVLIRRFFVVNPEISFTTNVKPAGFGSQRFSEHEVEININLNNANLPDPRRNVKVMIRQNGRWDNAIKDPAPRELSADRMVFDYAEGNTFKAGNEFRQFDLRTIRRTGQNVRRFVQDSIYHAFLYNDRDRGSRSYNKYSDFNGFRLIDNRSSNQPHLDGDYVFVHFFLDTEPTPADRNVYLFGALTDWSVREQYKLQYDPSRNGYAGTFLFKQGFYNYYYVTASPNGQNINHSRFEGDHMETSNDYSVYVYIKRPGDRTHRLAGFNMTTSGN